jgi:hypothetical protein
MKKPPGLRGFAGQPVVTLAVLGLGGFLLYQWVLDADAWLPGIVALAMMGWVMKAHSDVAAYKAWKRAWDGMDPRGAPTPLLQRPGAKPGLAVLAVLLLGLFLYANREQPEYGAAFAWLVVGGVFVAVVLLIRRGRRGAGVGGSPPRAAAQMEVVTICTRKPLIAVPDLRRAYEALPEHCWRVLKTDPS